MLRKSRAYPGLSKVHQGNWNNRKHYSKSIYKLVCGRTFRGQWGGQVRRYAAPCLGS